MAQEPAKAEGAAEAAPKSKKKLIVILAVVLALAAGGGAAAYFLMKKPDAHQAKGKHGDKAEKAEGAEDEAISEEEAEEAPEESGGHADPKTAPTYVQFETFTVNLLPDPDDKFLQLDLTKMPKWLISWKHWALVLSKLARLHHDHSRVMRNPVCSG